MDTRPNGGAPGKLLFVFGAGASHAEGAPLQSHILPYILNESPEIRSSTTGIIVRDFLEEHFGWDATEGIYPSLESVFAFLDYLIYRNESLGGRYTTEYIRNIRESLIKLIYYSVGKVASPATGVYRMFWERVGFFGREASVVTTNYDTFIDEAFDVLYPGYGFLDYCMHLMNYDYSDRFHAYRWIISPEHPIALTGLQLPPKRIKLIKLHGSLNWRYCNCCNQVLLTPWNTIIDLESRAASGLTDQCTVPDPEGYPCDCPHDGTPFQTLIVPPANLKILEHPAIGGLIGEAAREIRLASKVIFIGYSLPDADVHLKALFKKNLQSTAEVIVVNRGCDARVRKSYAALTRTATFVCRPFEQIMKDADAVEELFK
jgi:hypothetical protein